MASICGRSGVASEAIRDWFGVDLGSIWGLSAVDRGGPKSSSSKHSVGSVLGCGLCPQGAVARGGRQCCAPASIAKRWLAPGSERSSAMARNRAPPLPLKHRVRRPQDFSQPGARNSSYWPRAATRSSRGNSRRREVSPIPCRRHYKASTGK